MTAQFWPLSSPSSSIPTGQQRAGLASGRPLPLARPVPVLSAPEDVVHGGGRIDVSGRIAARAVIGALGWRGGDRLTLTADAGVVTANRDPVSRGARRSLSSSLATRSPIARPGATLGPVPQPGRSLSCCRPR